VSQGQQYVNNAVTKLERLAYCQRAQHQAADCCHSLALRVQSVASELVHCSKVRVELLQFCCGSATLVGLSGSVLLQLLLKRFHVTGLVEYWQQQRRLLAALLCGQVREHILPRCAACCWLLRGWPSRLLQLRRVWLIGMQRPVQLLHAVGAAHEAGCQHDHHDAAAAQGSLHLWTSRIAKA
jgi:hypothetical protein